MCFRCRRFTKKFQTRKSSMTPDINFLKKIAILDINFSNLPTSDSESTIQNIYVDQASAYCSQYIITKLGIFYIYASYIRKPERNVCLGTRPIPRVFANFLHFLVPRFVVWNFASNQTDRCFGLSTDSLDSFLSFLLLNLYVS